MTEIRGVPAARRLLHRLEDADTFYRPVPERPELSGAERMVHRYFPHALSHEQTDAAVAFASVNYGRWLVRCPWCPSAQHASRADHRFFCVECYNSAVGQRWVKVVWPEEARDIESVLLRRPKRYRNWNPGEAVVKLERENAEHSSEISGGL